MRELLAIFLGTILFQPVLSWAPIRPASNTNKNCRLQSTAEETSGPVDSYEGSLHGNNSCFLPLKQLDQDYYAPRIVQIAGSYPGITKEEFLAVNSEPSPEPGQWTYDFSDADGPQLGTVAIEGSNVVSVCGDPVVIIAEHTALSIPLPPAITEPVDIVVLVDREQNRFAERRFLLLDTPNDDGLIIRAFETKQDMPADCDILGRVVLCHIPWLPSMKPTKSGFLESDEYY